uniref:Hydrolase_4 domain-containing protein n=1 Tax=Mesocestoides corti TaxID=53468 RepID=A0A5K3F2J4_MESCO
MIVIFLLFPLLGLCYVVPIFCVIFPRAAIPLIYLHSLQSYQVQNFSNFAPYGIFDGSASNFYIQSDFDGTPLGTWHIRPKVATDFRGQNKTDITDGVPIFLYLHGIAFNRAYPSRVEVYKFLSRLGYHVMAIDYRGFGNSGGYPEGEVDIVADAVSLLRYARNVAPHSPVFIWGSSLGTGIAGSLVKSINETGTVRPPDGIVLDAPFTNMLAAAYHSPQGKAMRVVVAIWHLLKHIFDSLGIAYNSEANFQRANCPILILHSADDEIVPIQLGHTLYSTLKKANVDVTFKNLGFQGFGHNRNHEYPGAGSLIRDFVNNAVNRFKGSEL